MPSTSGNHYGWADSTNLGPKGRTTPVRTPTIKTAALLATAGMSIVALGTAHADDSDGNPDLASTTTVTAVVPPSAAAPTNVSTAPAATAASLPAAMTVPQFQAVLAPFLGPTTDLVGEFATLGVTPPAGVPTPDGAVIDSFFVYYYPDAEDPAASYYNAEVVFTTAVPAAEMVTLFQTQLVAAGYVQTGDSVQDDDGRQVRFLDYDVPNSTYDSAEVTVGIVDDDLDFAQVEWSDALDPAVMEAFSSWPTGLPLIEQATAIDSASLRVDSFSGAYSGSIDTNWKLPIAPADVRAQFDAALPTSPYTIDPDYEASPDSVYLLGGEFTSLSIYMGEGYPEGTTNYNVSARFDLQL